jgi:hypothetical protein
VSANSLRRRFDVDGCRAYDCRRVNGPHIEVAANALSYCNVYSAPRM